MPAPLCHFEFMTDNVARCKQFYGGIFDWTFDDQKMPGYTLIGGTQPGGDIMQRPSEAPGPCFMVYFMVTDIAATLKKIEAAGGHTLKPETPIPTVGAFAVFSDPEGNVLGLFRAAAG
jgi:hypothetical protein